MVNTVWFSRNSSANNYKFQDSYDWRNQRFNENITGEVSTLNATVGLNLMKNSI
jgi:hypothetical protein